MTELSQTQAYLLNHHGGDGALAAHRTHSNHARNHDEQFWQFWNHWVAQSLPSDGRIADLGAGVGLFINELARNSPSLKVTGIECAPYMLEQQVALPANASMLIDDLNDPRDLFPEHSLDACIANMLIHELHQPVLLFKRAKQWLKPGSPFVIIDMVRQPLSTYINHVYPDSLDADRNALEDAFGHFLEHNRYTPDDLTYLLERTGFRIQTVEAFKGGRAVRIAASA